MAANICRVWSRGYNLLCDACDRGCSALCVCLDELCSGASACCAAVLALSVFASFRDFLRRPLGGCAFFTILTNALPFPAAIAAGILALRAMGGDSGSASGGGESCSDDELEALGIWLLVQACVFVLHTCAALWAMRRFGKPMSPGAEKPEDRSVSARVEHLLCYDPVSTLYIFALLFSVAWTVVGSVRISRACPLDCSAAVCSLAYICQVCQWIYLGLGGSILCCAIGRVSEEQNEGKVCPCLYYGLCCFAVCHDDRAGSVQGRSASQAPLPARSRGAPARSDDQPSAIGMAGALGAVLVAGVGPIVRSVLGQPSRGSSGQAASLQRMEERDPLHATPTYTAPPSYRGGPPAPPFRSASVAEIPVAVAVPAVAGPVVQAEARAAGAGASLGAAIARNVGIDQQRAARAGDAVERGARRAAETVLSVGDRLIGEVANVQRDLQRRRAVDAGSATRPTSEGGGSIV